MRVQEIWKFIHPRVSYSPRALPSGNMILLPRGIWYSWVNTFSYFLNPHAMNVLLYRMKPRKLIHVKYCWQTYFKSNGTLSDNSGGKNRDASEGGIWFIFHGIWFLSCVIACSTFYPLSNQINLFTVIMRYNNKYYHRKQYKLKKHFNHYIQMFNILSS